MRQCLSSLSKIMFATPSALRTRTTLRRRSARCSSSAAVAARAIAENNMNNARTTSRRSRANRRVHQFRSRGRVRPRRLGLSKVVVFNATYETVGAKKDGKYFAAALSAFGEDLSNHTPTHNSNFFTGKPYIEGLGHAFLFRNYRASLGKWQTADPLGYPDGWNQLAYCRNWVTSAVDLWGCATVTSTIFERGTPTQPDAGGVTGWGAVVSDVNMTMRSISVEVVVTVAFAEKLKDSSQFAKGDIARYTPHSGLSGGVITIVSQNPDGTCVREAVVAHEYGHANYAASTICADLRSSLSLLEAKWNVNQWWSEVEVRHEIDAIIKAEAINSMIGFCNAANDPTIAWFQSSPEWRFVHDDRTAGYWEWVKE